MRFIYLFLIVLLASCHTSRNIQRSTVNTDSVVTSVRDSFLHVIDEEYQRHAKEISDITTSGVVFENEPCLGRDSLLKIVNGLKLDSASLSSLSRAIKSEYTNKVKILSNNSIEAEGRIRSVNLTAQRWLKEVDELGRRNDSLTAELERKDVLLSKKETTTVKIIKINFPPLWMILVGLAVIGVLWFYDRNTVKTKLKKFLNLNNTL